MLTPVQPERSTRQSEQSRDQERNSAEDVQVGRDWRAEQRDGDRMGQRRMGRMSDEDDGDHRTVGRNWRMQRDHARGYYDEDRPRTRVKICTEYENGDEIAVTGIDCSTGLSPFSLTSGGGDGHGSASRLRRPSPANPRFFGSMPHGQVQLDHHTAFTSNSSAFLGGNRLRRHRVALCVSGVGPGRQLAKR